MLPATQLAADPDVAGERLTAFLIREIARNGHRSEKARAAVETRWRKSAA
jgi:hypothetical protein